MKTSPKLNYYLLQKFVTNKKKLVPWTAREKHFLRPKFENNKLRVTMATKGFISVNLQLNQQDLLTEINTILEKISFEEG